MKILQTRERQWFLDQVQIVSATSDLEDAIPCQERLLYATMRNYYCVLESYEETHETLTGCYAALLRFYEWYTQPTRYVWINSDADTPLLNERFGRSKTFLGELRKQDYQEIKDEVKRLNSRCVVIRRDWYIQFRDSLIMT